MPPRNRTITALLAAVLSGTAAFASPGSGVDQRAQALLHASIAAPKHVSYVGQMEVIQWGTSRAAAAVFRIEHRAPNLTRRWYLAPQTRYGDFIVTHGATSYTFDVKHTQVVVSTNPAVDDETVLNGNFDLLTANYRAVTGGSETIAGRAVTSLMLMNKFTGEMALRLWIDSETKLVIQKQTFFGNGAIERETRFDQIRFTNDLPNAIFSTSVPKGYRLVRGAKYGAPSTNIDRVTRVTGFHIQGPKYLPEGFALTSADVTNVKDVRTVHLLYSDGIRTLSLFENAKGAAPNFGHYKPRPVRVENHDGQYVEDGPMAILTWSEANLNFALVSDLSKKELIRIAASVVP